MKDIKLWEDGGRILIAIDGAGAEGKVLAAQIVSTLIAGTPEVHRIEGLKPVEDLPKEDPPIVPTTIQETKEEKHRIKIPFYFGPYAGKTAEQILHSEQMTDRDKGSIWLLRFVNQISDQTLKSEIMKECKGYWISIADRDVSGYQKADVLEFFDTFYPAIASGIKEGLKQYGYADYHVFIEQEEDIVMLRNCVHDLLQFLKNKCIA